MELSSSTWLSDLGMDDPSFIHQCEMSTLDQLTSHHIVAALDDDYQNSFSSESRTSYPAVTNAPKSTAANMTFPHLPMGAERSSKLAKTGGWNSHKIAAAAQDASSPRILSFGRPDAADDPGRHLLRGFVGAPVLKPGEEAVFSISSPVAQGVRRVTNSAARPPSHTHDHIIAERRRREKISEMFIALSAMVPGLKKMDKASVLGDAIKYVKQLEERVKTLEEQGARRTVESVVLVKKSQLPADDDTSSSGENFDGAATISSGGHLPEVEVKVSDKSVLVRVHCEKRKGLLVRVLDEVEKLHLNVVNTSVMPFAGSALDITVIAQIKIDEKGIFRVFLGTGRCYYNRKDRSSPYLLGPHSNESVVIDGRQVLPDSEGAGEASQLSLQRVHVNAAMTNGSNPLCRRRGDGGRSQPFDQLFFFLRRQLGEQYCVGFKILAGLLLLQSSCLFP